MARTIAEVKAQMIAQKNALQELNGLDSPSQTAFWNLYVFLVAAAIVTFETINDVYTATWQTLLDKSYPGSQKWVLKQVFKFQYSTTTPQFVQYNEDTNTVGYPVTNTELQIITRAGVETLVNKTVLVKVAKSEPPAPLDATEQNSLLSYLYANGFAGITYAVISLQPDRLYLVGNVLYSGQYASTIEQSVIDALDAFLANFSQSNFNQAFTINQIIDVIQSVPGVIDFVPSEMAGRRQIVAWSGRTKFYDLAAGVNQVKYKPYAGYIIQEDTSTKTFADTLTFVASDVI